MKELNKISGWYDAYKSVRKPMPPAGSVMKDKRPEAPFEEDELSIEDLKNEAQIVCEGRGHLLKDWADTKRGKWTISVSICEKCNKSVTVIEHPTVNERDIMGEAFLNDCDKLV
jgi:hypothetical protein